MGAARAVRQERIEAMKAADADRPLHPILRGRWSPRAFASRPVDRETLLTLFEAARWAPSSFNEQPWAFMVARRGDDGEFERVLGCLSPGNREWAAAAPVLMLTFGKMVFERNGRPNRHRLHDVGLAVANLTFQTEAMGLHVHQMAGFDAEEARREFGVPEDWEPATAVAMGYLGDPDDLPGTRREAELRKRTRKPVDAFVFTGDWGRAADFGAAAGFGAAADSEDGEAGDGGAPATRGD